jgi:bifunctional UDP-N-acetylglucosamine pyrophosphorylase/glucosamine-1-phosphate N-acetyltransferase
MDVTAIILAAGKGTRMKSEKPKVLHELFFSPMIHHVLDVVSTLSVQNIIVVTGYHGQEVEAEIAGYGVKFVRQEQQLGTGHAVLAAEEATIKNHGAVLVLCGDTPLIKAETLRDMLKFHCQNAAQITVMTTRMDDPTNYGRIISNDAGELQRIVEEKDASEKERKIQQVNAGIYCVERAFLFETLKKVGVDNLQGEIYFTDIVKIATDSGVTVKKFVCEDSSEIIGVNSRVELEKAAKILQKRRNRELMDAGISIMDSDTIFIEKTVSIGGDSIIYPHVFISGKTEIGRGVKILPFTRINDMKISDYALIPAFSNLSGKSHNQGR